VFLSAAPAFGQALERTITVDPSGNANQTTISNAIAAIDDDRTVRWTVLVYAGTYNEAIVLDDVRENIDIIGVDGEAVVIVAPADMDAITIKGVGARNNTIRNVTIIADDDTADQGRGIVIDKEGTGSDPSAILIDGVTIQTNGDDSDGISFDSTASDVEIRNTRITTMDGHGIQMSEAGTAPTNMRIDSVTIRVAGDGKRGIDGAESDTVLISASDIKSEGDIGVESGDRFFFADCVVSTNSAVLNEPALRVNRKTGCRVANTEMSGARALQLGGANPVSSDVIFSGCSFNGHIEGMYVTAPGPDIVFQNCSIVAKNTGTSGALFAVYLDFDGAMDTTFQSCRIEAIGDATWSNKIVGVQVDNTTGTQFLDCEIIAASERVSSAVGDLNGIRCRLGSVIVVGGRVHASQGGFDKVVNGFDVHADETGNTAGHVFIDNVSFSSWIGRINATGRGPQAVTQVVNDISDADDDLILQSTTLPTAEDPVTPDAQPDVYRVLTVTGTGSGIGGKRVYIEGTNWGGDRIVEEFTMVESAEVKGKRPFRTVASILLPAGAVSQSVKVGVSNTLGLYSPIESEDAVLQQARAANVTSSYAFENVGTVDAVYSTVDVDLTLNGGDSVQWLLLAPR